MGRRNNFESMDEVMVLLNTGGFADIMSGRYLPGIHGEMLLNGGLSHLTGIAGPGNSFKTALMWFFILSVLDGYRETEAVNYDTEVAQQPSRPIQLSWAFERIMSELVPDVVRSKALTMTNAKKYLGDTWYSMYCDVMAEKEKNPGENLLTSMFADETGGLIKAMRPDIYSIDSLSNFRPSKVEEMTEKFDIGDSKRNMETMTAGRIKSQMLMEMPVNTARGGGFVIMSAHVGEAYNLDPHSPPAKKLAFLNQKFKLKDVPEKFTFLMNNLFYLFGAVPLWNSSSDKIPKYPRDSDDKMDGDTDLMIVNCSNLRGKTGGSGMPVEIIVSQSEGVLNGLTEFEYLRTYNRYGIDGSLQNYFLDLYPECKLSRTVIRGKMDGDYKLRRATHITYEMCYMKNCWHQLDEKYLEVTPEMLYKGLKEKGYDWNVLLETDPRHNFLELMREGDRPYLSTFDLLRMYFDEYKPYWMDEKYVAPWVQKGKGKK